ncbi:MAG: right-handed parallel beta-helix repeat-containing protein, partial [Ignavibacteriae bacterium]|nr:right-handed parallel beta-helix repeat-containing protein [Ignavibacteriota bacterium]
AREGSKPVIRNNIIYENGIDRTGDEMPVGAGAGIGADSTGWLVKPGDEQGNMIIENNIVYDNPSGGIMARNNSLIYISRNTVYNNANFQIAVNDSSQGVIDTNIIYSNSESNYSGGGIVVARNSNAEITGNTISNTDIACVMVSENCTANIVGNRIDSCKQAGIRVDSTAYQVNIENNIIRNNQAVGIYLKMNGARIRRNLIVDNISGGISSDSTCSNFIYNNTIVSKNGTTGRGIYVASNTTGVVNNIIWGYSVGVFKENSPNIDYNCTYNNNGYNGPPGTGGQNAINANPEFVDFDNNDFHLKSNSPCIDKGDPNPFLNDPDSSRADIGCYPYGTIEDVSEYSSEFNSIQIYPTIASDLLTIRLISNENQFDKINIYIYNVLGNKVDEIFMNNSKIIYKVSELSKGVYFIKTQKLNKTIPFIKE